MKDKAILIVMIVSLAFNLGVLVMFATLIIRGRAIHNEGPQIEEKIQRRLNLTPEQEKELDSMRNDMQDEIQPLQTKMENKREEAFKLLEEQELDTEKRDELFAEIADLQMQNELAMFNHMYEVKGELTPKQQEIFLESMQEKICPKGGPMGPGHGRGRSRGGPGFNRRQLNEGMEQPFRERRKGFEGVGRPEPGDIPGDAPDDNESGDGNTP